MKEIIEARLARRTAERDQLGAEFQALRQRIQDVEGMLVRATIACEELAQLLTEEDTPADGGMVDATAAPAT